MSPDPEKIRAAVARIQRDKMMPTLTPKAHAILSAAEASRTRRVARVHHDAAPEDLARRHYVPRVGRASWCGYENRHFFH